MDTLGIYNSALAAAVNHLATAITAVIGASYDPTDARGSIDRMTPEITELVRAARAEAYEAAATAIRAFAAEQGVTAPYVPAMPGYPEAAVRASLRESLMVSRDPSGRTAAMRLSQHARDAARQTIMRTVEDGREAAPGVDRAYSALDETPRPVEDMPRDPEDEKDAPTGRRDHLSVVRDPDDEKEVQSDDGPRGLPKLDRTSTEYLQGRIEDPMREMVEVHAKSWARVLTGAENCAFCVMLASRGPVYRSADDAGRLDASEMLDDADAGGYVNTYHSGCDCLVVPVYSWKSWPGRDSWLEAKRIYDAAAKEELALPEDERTQADNFMIGALDKYLRRHRDDGDPMERIPEIPAAPAVPRLAVA